MEDLEAHNVGISPRDTGQLFGCCVDAPPDINFAIVQYAPHNLLDCWSVLLNDNILYAVRVRRPVHYRGHPEAK